MSHILPTPWARDTEKTPNRRISLLQTWHHKFTRLQKKSSLSFSSSYLISLALTISSNFSKYLAHIKPTVFNQAIKLQARDNRPFDNCNWKSYWIVRLLAVWHWIFNWLFEIHSIADESRNFIAKIADKIVCLWCLNWSRYWWFD